MKTRIDSLDWDYILGELEKLGIAEFEERNRSLAMHLFGGSELTEEDGEMLKSFMESGAYGNITHRAENVMKKNGWGKARYALHRLRVPMSKKDEDYEFYAKAYPMFYGHKIRKSVRKILEKY